MRHLATAKAYIKLDLIACHQKAPRLVCLCLNIMIISFWHKAELLQFGLLLVLARLALLLALLITELAVIEQSANRRHGVWRNFYQIKPAILGELLRIAHGDDPDLRAVFVDEPYFTGANTIINAEPISDFWSPSQ